MKKRLLIILLLSGVMFLSLEITLRKVWGFGDMLLFKEDENFEYISESNQFKERFGYSNLYNEYSMRSKPISPEDTCIVLGFGDSVLNGGVLTDHDSLATTIVENQLNGVRFLNISAGSWGPDNCAEYLMKYGDFNAKMIILFVSSHDAHDNMMHEKTVGYNVSYPDKQYPLATIEVLARYIIPRISNLIENQSASSSLMINKNGAGFNSGFEFFNSYTKKAGIPFLICLHAETSEVEENIFNEQGEEIINYCRKNDIKLISGLTIGEKSFHFRDQIHLNEKGQKLWSTVLLNEINETLRTYP